LTIDIVTTIIIIHRYLSFEISKAVRIKLILIVFLEKELPGIVTVRSKYIAFLSARHGKRASMQGNYSCSTDAGTSNREASAKDAVAYVVQRRL
jgi:hypothetical protein